MPSILYKRFARATATRLLLYFFFKKIHHQFKKQRIKIEPEQLISIVEFL